MNFLTFFFVQNLVDGRIIATFVLSNRKNMKRYKVKQVIKILEEDGWYLNRTKGDHRQFKHPTKRGTVTVPGKPSADMEQEILNSIWKQAGWK